MTAVTPRSLLDDLRSRSQDAPLPGSLRLWIGDHACGWVAPAAQPVLAQVAGIVLSRDAVTLTREDAADAVLAEAALALREAGCLRGWRNERLDVPDAQGTVRGRLERTATRPLGTVTRAVHLNAWTPDGALWIAQRALTKNTDPGLWDTLVGGLVAADESSALALLRESDEEAGLSPADLAAAMPGARFLVTRHLPEGYQVEWVDITECVLPAGCAPANRDGEVVCIRTASPEEVLHMLAAGQFTLEAALSILHSPSIIGHHLGTAA